jgi:UDP-N-acetylglucosamine/UDP-N-acetylgalactosamine 4-epimerase
MGFEETKAELMATPRVWVVTGVAGFIGSNLLEALLRLNQRVVGLDNLSTGQAANLAQVQAAVGPARWKNFKWIEGDIQDAVTCHDAVERADYVLHQAALGSVPRSVAQPTETNASNVTGFLNMLWAARENGIQRFVFASSSSVYGDVAALPQLEDNIGNCLSPYAVTKRVNELYAGVFARCYGMQSICLRYFNVFGPRQDPNGPYAAVIPKWVAAMIQNEPVYINGDGTTSRDFCYVANVVQANILAATTACADAVNTVYNIALGDETTLSGLFQMLRDRLLAGHPHLRDLRPVHRPFQPGDVRHSRADIGRARRLLGYEPTHRIENGLDEALSWYVAMHTKQMTARKAPEQAPSL